jgi:uncharacterized iron-regulated membrane protein
MKQSAFRKLLLDVHLWVGALLAVPLILIGLSGSALLVQREVLYYQVPRASVGKMQPVAAIASAAQRAIGTDADASWIAFPESAGRPAAVEIDVVKRPRKTLAVYIDPVTLHALGQPYAIVRRGPVMTMFTDMHEFLDLPSGLGLRVVGWVGIGMMFMALTGMILWWPRLDQWKNGQWKNNFLVRRGVRGLRLHLDLHHAIGIWGLPMFFFLGLSGVYLTFPQSFGELLKTVLPEQEQMPDQRPVPLSFPATAEQAIQYAQGAVAGGRVVALQLPGHDGFRYNVQMEPRGWALSFPPIAVTFDRNEPGLMTVDDPSAYPAAERFMNAQYSLHFATGTGWLWTFLVFLAGLMPAALAITGLTVWWKRRAAKRRERAVLEPELGLAPASNA